MEITITATKDKSNGQPLFLTVTAPAAAADLFPKAANMKVASWDRGNARTTINLQPTKGNDRNDAGIKRFNTILRSAAKHGLTVNYRIPQTGHLSTHMTEAEITAATAL